MSEKRLDAKNRWRNVVVAFRMSPEEAQELNVKVSLSGLSKQDYIIQCLLKHEIRVVGGMKVAKKVQVHLDTILEELQTLDESDRGIDVEELLVPLKHVLDILQSDEKGNIDTSYPEDRAKIIRVIAGIANNINQAVKLGNSQGRLYYSDIDKLQNSLDDVKKTFGEVLEVWRLQRS